MGITSGSFLNPEGGSLYIPDGTFYGGWGRDMSHHVVGPDTKPLPDRVEITFYSYLEDKFYRGEFALPYARILQLFADGYRSYLLDGRGHDTYNMIVAGVAPGGAVSVWVSGGKRQQEVFFGYAQEVELDWHQTMHMPPNVDRMEILEMELADAAKDDPLVPKMRAQIPFGLWATYREQYAWQPVFEMETPDRIDRIFFYNGERDYIELPLDEAALHTKRPVPSSLVFILSSSHVAYDITFDEAEMLATFKRLGAGGELLQLVFTHLLQDGKSVFCVLVRNRNEVVELRELKREFYLTKRVRHR